MAIYHFHAEIVSRKTGRSSVAAAAYRAAEKIRNERDGITHDYTRKKGVVHAEILLPENAPDEFADRAKLWNTVEQMEKRIDSQTAREINIALPIEIDRQEQIEIIRKYVQDNFVSRGMCADIAIHDNGDGNPHAHVMLTMRDVSEKGFGNKNRDWNDKALLESWREKWADICNERFKEKGLDIRIDHRTLEAQGINREPTMHLGAVAHNLEKSGIATERGDINREIIARNEERTQSPEATADYIHDLKEGYITVDREITAIRQEISVIERKENTARTMVESIEERADWIQDLNERVGKLQSQRQEMEILRNKKAIDEQIQSLEKSRKQAENTFKRVYNIVPKEAPAEIKRLESTITDMEQTRAQLESSLPPLLVDKEAFKKEYHKQKLLADISRDRQKILDRLEQLERETCKNKLSARENIARQKSERELAAPLAEQGYNEILRDIQPEQVRVITVQREHKKELEMEYELEMF